MYAHQGGGDMFKIAAGKNMPRHRKDKFSIPILPHDNDAHETLIAHRRALRRMFASEYKTRNELIGTWQQRWELAKVRQSKVLSNKYLRNL
jgi:hypothetical protein